MPSVAACELFLFIFLFPSSSSHPSHYLGRIKKKKNQISKSHPAPHKSLFECKAECEKRTPLFSAEHNDPVHISLLSSTISSVCWTSSLSCSHMHALYKGSVLDLFYFSPTNGTFWWASDQPTLSPPLNYHSKPHLCGHFMSLLFVVLFHFLFFFYKRSIAAQVPSTFN